MDDEMIENLHKFGARMSMKMHLFRPYFDYFPENYGKFNEE